MVFKNLPKTLSTKDAIDRAKKARGSAVYFAFMYVTELRRLMPLLNLEDLELYENEWVLVYVGATAQSRNGRKAFHRLMRQICCRGYLSQIPVFHALAALLREKLSLNVYLKGSRLLLTSQSKEALTAWATINLRWSWMEFDLPNVEAKKAVEEVEKSAIRAMTPIFNWAHNPRRNRELKSCKDRLRKIT